MNPTRPNSIHSSPIGCQNDLIPMIEARRLRRISRSQPTAWEAQTQDGRKLHISYLYGRLRVEVLETVNAARGWKKWNTILDVIPELVAAEVRIQKVFANRNKVAGITPDRLREQVRLGLERRYMAERRASNNGRPTEPGQAFQGGNITPDRTRAIPQSRVVTQWELRDWMQIRNDYFDLLQTEGIGGEPVRVAVSADETPRFVAKD